MFFWNVDQNKLYQRNSYRKQRSMHVRIVIVSKWKDYHNLPNDPAVIIENDEMNSLVRNDSTTIDPVFLSSSSWND